jgi:hypothetical protein
VALSGRHSGLGRWRVSLRRGRCHLCEIGPLGRL